MELYALKQSCEPDRLFTKLTRAKDEAEILVNISSDDHKIFSPDSTYYFYAKNIRTHGYIKIIKTKVES